MREILKQTGLPDTSCIHHICTPEAEGALCAIDRGAESYRVIR